MRKFNIELTLKELNELYFILSSSKTKAMIELKKYKDENEEENNIVSQLNEMLESYNSMLAKVEEKISRK